MAAPKSKESAYRQALTAYLESETDITWQYFDNSHVPSDPPKGGVYVYRLFPIGKVISGLQAVYHAVFQLRILVTGINEGVIQDELLDYTRWVDNLLRNVAITGITGVYNEVSLKKALMGIKLSERGIVYEIARSADNKQDAAISGIGILEYECKLEV